MSNFITKSLKSFFAGIALIAMNAVVQAGPISYTYESGNVNKVLSSALGLGILPSSKHLLQYDLFSGSWSNEGTPTSYDPTTDTLSNLELTLNFKGSTLIERVLNTWKDLSFQVSFGDLAPAQSSSTAATVTLAGIDLTGYDLNNFTSDILLTLTNPLSKVELVSYTLNFSGIRAAQEAVAVPSPSTLALLSLGLVGAGFFSRRRQQATHC